MAIVQVNLIVINGIEFDPKMSAINMARDALQQ